MLSTVHADVGGHGPPAPGLHRPVEGKGSLDEGAMGGEVLLLARGGCFSSNLIAAAKARDVRIDDPSVDVHGALDAVAPRFESITLEVRGRSPDETIFEKLIQISECGCIVHNTLSGASGSKSSECDLVAPSQTLPRPGAIPRVGQGLGSMGLLAARNFRADGIRGQRLAAYSNLEASRLSGVKYDASEENARTMILPQTCISCRRPQRLPSYAAGYAGLSNSSSAA